MPLPRAVFPQANRLWPGWPTCTLTRVNDVTSPTVPAGAFPDVVPELTKGVVRLRAMTEADLPFVVEQSNDPDSVRWTTVPQPYGLDAARDFLALHERGWAEADGTRHWAIELLPHDGAAGLPFAGIVDLRPGAKGGAWETGFVLHPAARGRGAMSDALRLAAQWAFDHGAPSLYWFAARGNFPSWRVAHACGFTRQGTLPSYVAGRMHACEDAWAASLLPGQPMAPRTPWIVPAVVEADGLRLRSLRGDDRAIAEPHDHPPHFVPAAAVPTPETVDEWLLRRREGMSLGLSSTWCIADPTNDEPLGEVVAFVPGGILTEPVAGGGSGLRRLVATTAADNDASNRVLTGAGFTVWGREPAADAPDGSVGPALHWERLAGG